MCDCINYQLQTSNFLVVKIQYKTLKDKQQDDYPKNLNSYRFLDMTTTSPRFNVTLS